MSDFEPGGKNYLPPEMVPGFMGQPHEDTCPDPTELLGAHATCPEHLPDDVRELLTILTEECSEVIQRCTKILRFGLRVNPWTGKHNRETLEEELGDIRAIVEMLAKFNVLDTAAVTEYAITKIAALRKPDGRLRHAKVPEGL